VTIIYASTVGIKLCLSYRGKAINSYLSDVTCYRKRNEQVTHDSGCTGGSHTIGTMKHVQSNHLHLHKNTQKIFYRTDTLPVARSTLTIRYSFKCSPVPIQDVFSCDVTCLEGTVKQFWMDTCRKVAHKNNIYNYGPLYLSNFGST